MRRAAGPRAPEAPAHPSHPPSQRLPVSSLAQQPLGPEEGDLCPLPLVAKAHPPLPPLLQLHGAGLAPQLGLPAVTEAVRGGKPWVALWGRVLALPLLCPALLATLEAS